MKSSSSASGMSQKLGSEKALVTGGQGGLGQALESCLQEAGINVLALGRDELDVTCPESVRSAFQAAGEIDLLVINAGLTIDKPLMKMTESDWAQVLDVNLRGAFLCAREVSRGMIKRRSGHILFISSFSALQPPAGQVNYAAAKSALLGMMKSMASELGSRNIRVNAILPGFLETKMTEGLSEHIQSKALEGHVLQRFNTVEAVADFVSFLHQTMPHTSGQVFNLDSRILP